MKKLMVMLGAVAMSFGLFATDYRVSFESTEGYSGGTFTVPGNGWAWASDPTAETAITLGAYNGDDYKYDAEGEKARRFPTELTQAQYLPLSTSGDTLTRTIGDGNVFVDQLVKFTGFEEDQDFTDDNTTKVALWLKATETEGATAGETNLYVSVGNTAGKTAVKLDGEYQPDTWYRLTIKSLGNVIGVGDERAGFLIYIDGQLVSSTEAKELFAANVLNARAAGFQAKGQLFPAMISANEGATPTFEAIGFKGIGAIDDIVIDAKGPEFAKEVTLTIPVNKELFEKIEVTVDGSKVAAINDQYTFAKGATVSIDMTAAERKIIKGDNPYIIENVEDSGTIVLEEAAVEVVDAVAQIGQNLYETLDNVLSAIDARQAAEEIEVEIFLNCTNSVKSRAFAADGVIVVDDDGWWVSGDATFVGVDTALTMESGTLTLSGAVTDNVEAETITVPTDATIALAVTAEIATKSDIYDAIAEVDGYTLKTKDDTPDVGWDTYYFEKILESYMLTVVPPANGTVTTFPEAPIKVKSGEEVVVSAEANAGYSVEKITMNGATVTDNKFVMPEVDAEVTAVITANVYKVTFDTDGGTAFADQEYTFGAGTFTLNPYSGTKSGFKFSGWTTGAVGAEIIENGAELAKIVGGYALTAVWEAEATRPPVIPEAQKVAYDTWANQNNFAKGQTDNIYADYFAIGLTDSDVSLAGGNVAKAASDKLAAMITADMVKALAAGNVAEFGTLPTDYPNAQFTFVKTNEIPSEDGVSGFYRLHAAFKPANKE